MQVGAQQSGSSWPGLAGHRYTDTGQTPNSGPYCRRKLAWAVWEEPGVRKLFLSPVALGMSQSASQSLHGPSWETGAPPKATGPRPRWWLSDARSWGPCLGNVGCLVDGKNCSGVIAAGGPLHLPTHVPPLQGLGATRHLLRDYLWKTPPGDTRRPNLERRGWRAEG